MNITVTNVEESPTIAAPMTDGQGDVKAGHTATSYAESTVGTPNIVIVSTYTATDDEDVNDLPMKPLKWSLSGADSSKFNISNEADTRGQLAFKASPDYETPASADRDNIYEVTVTVTDSAGNTDSRNVTVRVTNENEPGTVTLSSLQPEVGVDLTAKLTDPDGGITGLTWQWSNNSVDITGANSATYRQLARTRTIL